MMSSNKKDSGDKSVVKILGVNISKSSVLFLSVAIVGYCLLISESIVVGFLVLNILVFGLIVIFFNRIFISSLRDRSVNVGSLSWWLRILVEDVRYQCAVFGTPNYIILHLFEIQLLLQLVWIVVSVISFVVIPHMCVYLIELRNMVDDWVSANSVVVKNYVSGVSKMNEGNIHMMSGGPLLGKPLSSVLGAKGSFSGGVLPCRLELPDNQVEEIGLSKERLSKDCMFSNKNLERLRSNCALHLNVTDKSDKEFNSFFLKSVHEDLRAAAEFKLNHFGKVGQISGHFHLLFPTEVDGKLCYVVSVYTHTKFSVFDGGQIALVGKEDIISGAVGITPQYYLFGLRVDPATYHMTYNVPGDVTKFRDLWDVPMRFKDQNDGSVNNYVSRHSWVASKYPEVMDKALGLEGVDITPLLKEQLKHTESVLKYLNRYGKI